MIPATFDYLRASSVADAIRLLGEHGDDAKLLAGGHSLIPMMKLRLATPATLIDITGIGGLDGIAADGGTIAIGALTKHAALASSSMLRAQAPVLWDAANDLGDPQVRNRGTIGGASAHGDPSADYPAVLLALDATLTLADAKGERTLRAREFFRGMFDTALDPRELLTKIAFAAAPKSAYVKFHHPASHYAVVGAAVALTMNGGRIGSARVAITGIGDAAFRAEGVERALAGVDPGDAAAIEAACANAAQGVEARSDTFASAHYRSAMADVFTARAVAKAAAR
ncbi:carbon monoxide dehydrogenase [Vulcanimicrobium alpinum]|uniref:Carbon monoxide dehydrogenase n=1 Tax=Vulcanimicrobium alpinum TaxID=3016050 RepID=A0AAN1XVP0_UNVUL|nr:xanthine dehydrogenase family protein subunit M [Vulcanimicrobium alpinum]BDE05844.1 carbon monoxide dehydrogenase [Vulcanimicrobium alpinum]